MPTNSCQILLFNVCHSNCTHSTSTLQVAWHPNKSRRVIRQIALFHSSRPSMTEQQLEMDQGRSHRCQWRSRVCDEPQQGATLRCQPRLPCQSLITYSAPVFWRQRAARHACSSQPNQTCSDNKFPQIEVRFREALPTRVC